MGILPATGHLLSVFCATPRFLAASAVFMYSVNLVMGMLATSRVR